MAPSALQVILGSGVLSLIWAAAAWGRSEEPVPFAQTRVGGPYRQRAVDGVAPLAVRLAAPVAWVVVAVSALRALVILLEILSMQIVGVAASVDCVSFPCEAPLSSPGPSFDALSGGLHGIYLMVTGAVIGAFARWARDAERDAYQLRRLAPFTASGVLVVVALGLVPLGNRSSWSLGLFHVGVVLLGAGVIAVARRNVGEGQAAIP